MSSNEYTVELGIFSHSLDPHKRTQQLGLTPCQLRIEGAVGIAGRFEQGPWAYDGDEGPCTWEHLAESLTFLLDKLWPHKELISAYAAEEELIW